MEKPLVKKTVVLEKFPGKGGWTYAALPEVTPSSKNPFGWIKVKGTIDGYAISQYHLMPMGNGCLFLPVKSEIRKKIRKTVGDKIQVELYQDTEPIKIPEPLLASLKDEPLAYKNFLSFTESEQKQYIDWMKAARKEDSMVERIALIVNRSLRGLKHKDPSNIKKENR